MTGGLSGESSSISVTGWPARIAAAYTNGLKVEPGWRIAWVARLDLESAKSRPPTMARTYPLLVSIATRAPWRDGVGGPGAPPAPLGGSPSAPAGGRRGRLSV